MKQLLLVVLVLAIAVGGLGYWRGWFSVTKEGGVDVQVDSAKFKQDKEAFSKSASEKARAVKARVTSLWTKSKELTGDEKIQVEKELGELEKKQERLEKQLKELEDAGQDRFEGTKQDLSKALEEVEQKIEELTKKLDKKNAK